MWSVGAVVLVEIVACATLIYRMQRRVLAELEPTRQSCELLRCEVARAVEVVTRDTGRAAAGRQLLLRRGKIQAPR